MNNDIPLSPLEYNDITNKRNLVIKRIQNALKMNLYGQVRTIFPSLHPKKQAELVCSLEPEERERLIYVLGDRVKPHLLIKLDDKLKSEIISYLNERQAATMFSKLLKKEAVVEELERDIELLENQKDSMFNTITSSIINRLPWLFISICLSSMTSLVVDSFSSIVEKLVVISALMPVISNISNITQGQTTTILCRDLGRIENLINDWKMVITRETIIGLFEGFVLSIFAGFIVYFWQSNAMLSLVFALSIFLVQGISCLFGATAPLLFQKLKLDPALGADMVAAALIDIVSFFVLFKIASLLL